MSNRIILVDDKGERCGTFTTSSPVIVLNIHSILLDGGVRIDTDKHIGMVYNDETNNVLYLNSRYASKNQHDPLIYKYLWDLRKKLKLS